MVQFCGAIPLTLTLTEGGGRHDIGEEITRGGEGRVTANGAFYLNWRVSVDGFPPPPPPLLPANTMQGKGTPRGTLAALTNNGWMAYGLKGVKAVVVAGAAGV